MTGMKLTLDWKLFLTRLLFSEDHGRNVVNNYVCGTKNRPR